MSFCPGCVDIGTIVDLRLLEALVHWSKPFTPGKINMEPGNGTLEDNFPLQPSGFQVPC